MIIKFKVHEQTLSAPYPPTVVSRSQDYLKATFSFTEDWYGTQKIAQFVRGELMYNITLDSVDACVVPWEILQTEGCFTVTVWGNNQEDADNIIITTNKVSISVIADGLNDELLPTDPTVGLEGGLLTQCQEAAENASTSEENASESEENAKASEEAALASAELAEKWATYTDGTVDGTNYSAKQYALNASTSETNAGTSETNASASATLAEKWASYTDGLVDSTNYSAKQYALNAATSETNAGNSEANALTYKNNASASATLAEKWANLTGSTVDGSEYSAKKYAQDAQASASAASASAAVLANTPHFEFNTDGELYLVYTS